MNRLLLSSRTSLIRPRPFSTSSRLEREAKNTKYGLYLAAVGVAAIGVAYASVPLYKIFCAATGFGGTPIITTMEKARDMVPLKDARPIRVKFEASTSDTLDWKFRPAQRSLTLVPGETALAFYTATNPTDEAITGVATYNVVPLQAGVYLHKVQCFCFDQQRLKPNEQVDMPILFFIDPEIVNDESMRGLSELTLSYTFFKAKKG